VLDAHISFYVGIIAGGRPRSVRKSNCEAGRWGNVTSGVFADCEAPLNHAMILQRYLSFFPLALHIQPSHQALSFMGQDHFKATVVIDVPVIPATSALEPDAPTGTMKYCRNLNIRYHPLTHFAVPILLKYDIL